MPATLANRSFRSHADLSTPADTVVFFPYAGSTAASGRRLLECLPAGYVGLSVQYPGKGDRKSEPEARSIEALATGIAEDFAEAGLLDGRPLTLYGHSLGAAVAFEVARRLESTGCHLQRLCVSGRCAPSQSLNFTLPLTDQVILDNLIIGGGIHPEVLNKPKFRDALVAGVRNDYTLNVTYRASPFIQLRTGMRFLLSGADPYVDEADAYAWAVHTAGGFELLRYPGGHFFIDTNLHRVAQALQ
ncbi:MAG: hypothetical protein B7X31_10665 [Thiomonas sp. 13-66-29]|jgi:surfactin synthase thioesterase subunit|nr:MAG: hypothetical protein B7X31_10665 [Thiomonas sp. 13-66-29]